MAYLLFCIFFSLVVSYSFSEYRLFASLGRFIPRYFILFVAVVDGIVVLISPSDVIVYLENPKLLEPINEFSQVTGYKINTQKLLAFL